ncbi:MAG TPA: S9 family peptidase [Caulobacteraceae bacterium]|jgi:oligopeptidase B
MTDAPKPPAARKEPRTIEQLGRTRTDDYAWMKDENWREVLRDPKALRGDIREHLQAENAYTERVLKETKALQEQLFAEMRGRIKEDDASVPAPDGPWDYYVRFDTGAQHPVHARRPRGADSGEQVLLDEEAESRGKPYFAVAHAEHSPDHGLYAWAADEQGSEVNRVHVRDLATGERVGQPAESASGDFTFSADGRWLYWIWRDEEARPAKVFRRPARGGPADDALVYEEPDKGMFLGVHRTSSEAYVVITSGNQETSDARLIPSADPAAAPRLVQRREEGVRYDIDHWRDRFVIRTNADGAVDFKLVFAEEADPSRATWRDFVPHQQGRFIAGFAAFKDWLARIERVDANNRIVVTRKEDLSEHEIAFDEDAYALSMEPGFEFGASTLRFVYQSPTTPRQWWDYDMATRERSLRKTQEVPSGHDPARYVTRRLFARAPDGAEVPVTVLMLRDTPLDGSAPLLLYGYGAYGIPMEPHFSIRNLSLVDRGWVWATAHVRGGSEKGWGWFLDGRKEKKPNTFTDFIACAEALVGQGYTRPGRIVAYGGSAGGMLMGAVANLRPELFAGIIAAVPFVDVLNTMSDLDLPLTPPEWPEWGDPVHDPDAYDRIAAYSPYDNVGPRPYPAILATSGLSDPRVTYWEPAKWVASLREHTTSDAPVLLKMNMEAGHGGASGRFDFLKEIALDYAFAIWAAERAKGG